MLSGQKFGSDAEVQLAIHQWLGQQPAFFFAPLKLERWDKLLNKVGQYVEK